jgi:hypothetical protein
MKTKMYRIKEVIENGCPSYVPQRKFCIYFWKNFWIKTKRKFFISAADELYPVIFTKVVCHTVDEAEDFIKKWHNDQKSVKILKKNSVRIIKELKIVDNL